MTNYRAQNSKMIMMVALKKIIKRNGLLKQQSFRAVDQKKKRTKIKDKLATKMGQWSKLAHNL